MLLTILKKDRLDSTNRYAAEELDLSTFPEYGIVWALEQTKGKGQYDSVWESEAGKNLTFSIVFHPTFLLPQYQFMLTKVLSLAAVDFLKSRLPQTDFKIKWPNDIYANNRKIIGMLTHNQIIGSRFATAIGGIGLNVNQEKFSENVSNPVSMKNLSGKEYDLETELNLFAQAIITRYEQLRQGEGRKIDSEYLSNLLNHQTKALYLHEGEEKEGVIEGVTDLGFLLLNFVDGSKAECDMKEIKLLMNY